ncbi:hypothetical protein MKX01_004692 [Papaver californicum]|nr:hypothetical protein MKX01_004692 [Papaver californicum]
MKGLQRSTGHLLPRLLYTNHILSNIAQTLSTLYIRSFVGELHIPRLSFNYPTIPIRYFPDFLFTANSSIVVDALQVTYDSSDTNMSNLSGRVCYEEKLKLWGEINKSLASFNTTFELNIMGRLEPGGEGIAFILKADDAVPDNSEGQWLGIVNATTNGSREAQIVAVEFDTKKSYMKDVDNNHLGLNINNIKSISQVPLRSYGVEL